MSETVIYIVIVLVMAMGAGIYFLPLYAPESENIWMVRFLGAIIGLAFGMLFLLNLGMAMSSA